MHLHNIGESWRKNKRLYAYFIPDDEDWNISMKERLKRKGKPSDEVITHFGLKDGETYVDHHDKELRDNYIARHRIREEKLWENDPYSAATLSRYILWGPYKSIEENTKYYRKLFNL